MYNNIIGNERILKNIRSSIKNGKVTHAYIIDGAKGMGKKLLSAAFAKALLCPNNINTENGVACGVCISCKTFDSGNNPDVIYVKPEKTKAIGVDDIRMQISKNMETKPYLYRYKIFIIDNANEMTIAAQNAFLKTLEEPAPYGVFILLSNNARSFLPTVLSRTVIFYLKPLTLPLVKKYIVEKTGISSEKAHFCAVYAQGNIGRALEIAENENFLDMREKIIKIVYGIKEKDLVDVLLMAKIFEEYKDKIQDALDIVVMWYRDLSVYIETKDENLLMQHDIKGLLLDDSEKTNSSDTLKYLNEALLAKRRLAQNGNFQLTMEIMLMQMNGIYRRTL